MQNLCNSIKGGSCCNGCKTSQDVLGRHNKIVFHLSGGKDSTAALLFLRPFWDKMTVVWCNTGDAFPETEKIIRSFAEVLPHFVEVNSDVKNFMSECGYPSDIVPLAHSDLGMRLGSAKDLKVCSAFDCTAVNLWIPVLKKTQELGATLVIRGQREEETLKTPIKSGAVEDGVEYFFPIEDWSKEEVLEYLAEQDFPIPDHFHFEESSLDCMSCTAFCHAKEDRRKWMRANYPEQYEINRNRIAMIVDAVASELSVMRGSM